MRKFAPIIALALFATGCTTHTYVKLPEQSVLKIKRGTEEPHQEGLLNRTPFSWSSASGIPYKVEKNGAVIQEGKLRAKFRVASLFWPPVAIVYWPIGFRSECYDLSGGSAVDCSPDTFRQLKSSAK